jgi:hypothetical protein
MPAPAPGRAPALVCGSPIGAERLVVEWRHPRSEPGVLRTPANCCYTKSPAALGAGPVAAQEAGFFFLVVVAFVVAVRLLTLVFAGVGLAFAIRVVLVLGALGLV